MTTHISTIYIYFSKIPAVSLYLCCFLTTGTYQYYISIYVEWVQVLHLSFNKGKYSVLHFDTFKISVQNYNIEHCKNNFYFEICRLYHILLFKISVNVWLAGMVISHVQFSVKLDNLINLKYSAFMLEKDPQIHCVFITTHWTKVNKVKKVSF